MSFFSKKPEANLVDFCRDFYEKYILFTTQIIKGVDAGAIVNNTMRSSIIEADPSFANVDPDKFAAELTILRFELFALAWLHKLGDKLAVAQSIFTKYDYLHEKKRDDIWDASESYTQAITRSATAERLKINSASSRYSIALTNKLRMDKFSEWYKEYERYEFDPKCFGRVAGRLDSDSSWKKGITAHFLMSVLCERLGFVDNPDEPNKEAQQQLTFLIRMIYDAVREALDKVTIKG